MASSLPRGITRVNGYYAIHVSYRRHHATACEATLFAAEIRKGRLLDDLISERPTGVPAPDIEFRPWTLEHAFDRTAAMVWSHGRDAGHSLGYGRAALNYFGRHTLVKFVTLHAIDHWTEHLRARGLANSTINHHLSALSRMIRFTYHRRGTDHLPMITRLLEPAGRTRYLTLAEEQEMFRVLEDCRHPDDPAFIRVLLDTGMRVGEVMKLTDGDVDLDQGLIHIWFNKVDTPRSIPMTDSVRQIMQDRVKGGRRTRKLFPRSYHYYHRVWQRIRCAMDLQQDAEFVIHCLRHTCATRMIYSGVHLLTVKEWLGHKTLLSTMRYLHMAPHNLMEGVTALENIGVTGCRPNWTPPQNPRPKQLARRIFKPPNF
ncbi:MAG TPA: site-specific integrase [Alphaproteobacteria bacterium]|jgi:integrase